MKQWRYLLAFLVTGLIGSGAAVLLKSRRATQAASAVSATQLSMMSPDEAAAVLKKEIAEARKESGQALKERLTGMFKLLGIEASWAEALAANSAAGFPALMDKLPTGSTGQRALLELILLDRWAQLDPRAVQRISRQRRTPTPRTNWLTMGWPISSVNGAPSTSKRLLRKPLSLVRKQAAAPSAKKPNSTLRASSPGRKTILTTASPPAIPVGRPAGRAARPRGPARGSCRPRRW